MPDLFGFDSNLLFPMKKADPNPKRKRAGRPIDPDKEMRLKSASAIARSISAKSGLTSQQLGVQLKIGSGDGNAWNRLLRGEGSIGPSTAKRIAEEALANGWYSDFFETYCTSFEEERAKLTCHEKGFQQSKAKKLAEFEVFVQELLVEYLASPELLVRLILDVATKVQETPDRDSPPALDDQDLLIDHSAR